MCILLFIFSDIRGFQCTTCFSVFSTLDYVKSHAKSVHGTFLGPDYYHCPHCNYSSQIQSTIERHSSTHYRNTSPCKCENTRNNRNNAKDVASRVQDEGKSNVGQIQGDKGDGDESNKGDYSKERPYTCNTCGKTFKQQGHLTAHQRVHTGEKPYKCTICGKTFTQHENLTRHQLVHTGVKSYVCNTCGNAFGHQHHLTLHHRIHTGEKPYTCIICGQSFKQQIHLTEHNRIHTGEKPYSCTVCALRYSQSSSLKRHMKSKHKPVEE